MKKQDKEARLTINQACDLLSCTRYVLWRYTKNGLLKVYGDTERGKYYLLKDILSFERPRRGRPKVKV